MEPFDPVVLTVSERVHGYMTGDGLLAYLLLFESTQRRRYLDDFITHADRLLALRDSERGMVNQLGISLPAWGHEPMYLSYQVLIPNRKREPTLSLLTPQPRDWDQKVIPERSHARVVHRGRARFALELTLNGGGPGEMRSTWDNLTMDPNGSSERDGFYVGRFLPSEEDRIELKGHLKSFALYDLGLPGSPHDRVPAEGVYPLQEGRYVQLANTGPLTFPLAFFSRLVLHDQRLNQDTGLREKAGVYLAAAKTAVETHDSMWRESRDGRGWYVHAATAPHGNAGFDDSVNHCNVLGLALLELAAVTGDGKYLDRAEKLAATFRANWETPTDPETAFWGYWMKGGPTRRSVQAQEPETLGFAGVNTLFAFWSFRHGVVFQDRDIQRIANSWMRNVVKPDLGLANTLTGEGEGRPDEQWRFLVLGAVDQRLYSSARQWYVSQGWQWLEARERADPYLGRYADKDLPADQEARRHSPRHRIRMGWATLAWVAAQAQHRVLEVADE